MAAGKEAKFQRELMVKKLETRIAAVVATATATMVAPQRRLLVEENDITGEVPPKVINIILGFASLF